MCMAFLWYLGILSFHFIFYNASVWFAVVILVPTRELALQTSQVCKELGKHLKIQVMVTTGGTSLKDDIVRLYQPVHLLVGTPGRILDLTKKGVCILKDCSMLIMDEVIYFKLCLNAIVLLVCYSRKWPVLPVLCYMLFSNVSCPLFNPLMSTLLEGDIQRYIFN